MTTLQSGSNRIDKKCSEVIDIRALAGKNDRVVGATHKL